MRDTLSCQCGHLCQIIWSETDFHFHLYNLKGGCTSSSESIHVKCHIVRNLMSRLNYVTLPLNYIRDTFSGYDRHLCRVKLK